MTVRSFLPVQLIRCTRFLYYLSVYVNLFKELFLVALEVCFSIASAKVVQKYIQCKLRLNKIIEKIRFFSFLIKSLQFYKIHLLLYMRAREDIS